MIRLVACACLAGPQLVMGAGAAAGIHAPGQDGPYTIDEPTHVERDLSPGEEHVFEISLDGKGQALAELTEIGIDVLVQAADDDEALILDSAPGRFAVERLVIKGNGSVTRLTIASRLTGVPGGRYALRLSRMADHPAPIREAMRIEAAARRSISRADVQSDMDPERYAAGLRMLSEAASLWEGAGRRRDAALAHHSIGYLYRISGRLDQAMDHFGTAADRYARIDDEAARSVALKDLGSTLLLLGRFDAARQTLEAALDTALGAGHLLVAATSQNDLCVIGRQQGSATRADQCYDGPLDTLLSLGERNEAALTLHNIAVAQATMGRPGLAVRSYGRAIALHRELGDRELLGKTLRQRGKIRFYSGDLQGALDDFAAAREAFETMRDPVWIANLLTAEGEAYFHLGQHETAIELLGEAVAGQRAAGHVYGLVAALNVLATSHMTAGDFGRARSLLLEGLDAARRADIAYLEARAWLRLGQLSVQQGRLRSAQTYLAHAAARSASNGLASVHAMASMHAGQMHLRAGHHLCAERSLHEALEGYEATGNALGRARARIALARVLGTTGRLEQARFELERAAAQVDELSSALLSPFLQTSFLGNHRALFEELIGALFDLHTKGGPELYVERALEYAERIRARSLVAFLDARQAAPLAAEPGSIREERIAIKNQISRIMDRHIRRSERRPDNLEWDSLLRLTRRLDGLDDQLRRAGAARVPRAEASTQEIQGALDHDTVLLEYLLAPDASHLWMITPEEVVYRPLPGRAALEARVARALQRLHDENDTRPIYRDAGFIELSRLLLGVTTELEGVGRLVIVPDGRLYDLPFAALSVPARKGRHQEPALRRYEIVRVPSATALLAQRDRGAVSRNSIERMMVFADPAFGDHLRPLPGASEEAQAILRHAGGREVAVYTGPRATRERLLGADLDGVDAIHFATHGIADAYRGELSGITLSMVDDHGSPVEGFVGIRDVYDLRLNASLVVLSGCETAAGRAQWGEMPIGLAAAFLYAGVPRVLTSLWRVPDRSAALLMDRFYDAMLNEGRSTATALRAAQLALYEDRRFRHPAHWAAYVHTGDWRQTQ